MQPNELAELKQLVVELKADRAAQKEKEKRESWTKYVSLSMVFLAVLAGWATLKGGGFTTRTLKEMNEATFNQAAASDQWSFYQAKSIKQNLYEIELDHLNAAPTPEAGRLEKLKAKVDKYEKEKADITAGAKKYEAVRDQARETAARAADHSKEMGLAITFYQIAIALGGVCLIVKKKPLWLVSCALGVGATIQLVRVLYYMPL
jgi:Na+-translocating ferredoxin:NAD+ oxidoreductase RnfD subunit